jgi:hypothetical protein
MAEDSDPLPCYKGESNMIVLKHQDFYISIPDQQTEFAIHWNTYQLDEDGNLVEDQIRGDTFEYSDVFLETPNYQYVFRKVHYGSYAAQQIIEQIESHLFFNEVTYIDLNMLPPSPGFHMEGKLEICHRNSR